MSRIHINVGHLLAQPYESDYAIWRRCLVSNPGLTLSTIVDNLRSHDGVRHRNTTRLKAIQQINVNELIIDDPLKSIRNRYRRQCPECARQLYHTVIYSLSWLTRCPIHHCEFTTECPVCGQLWPSIKEMSQRYCPGCGRASIRELADWLKIGNKEGHYQPVIDIYSLIETSQYDNESNLVLDDDRDDSYKTWWRKVPVEADIYPSMKAHLLTAFTDNKLAALHVNVSSVYSRTARMLRRRRSVSGMRGQVSDAKDGAALPFERCNIVEQQYEVMKKVVDWVSRHTAESHHLQLYSYHHLRLEDWLDRPQPCPYCLAVSMWFYSIAASYYPASLFRKVNAYPFCDELGFDGFYGCVRPVLRTGKKRYFFDGDFEEWFYKRGLEITFVDMLRFAFHLGAQIMRQNKKDDERRSSDALFVNENQNHYYLAQLSHLECEFLYGSESPLESYTPNFTKGITRICRSHHRAYRQLHQGHNNVRLGRVNNQSFDIDSYLSLRIKFDEQLDML